jgi:hypothetical protein
MCVQGVKHKQARKPEQLKFYSLLRRSGLLYLIHKIGKDTVTHWCHVGCDPRESLCETETQFALKSL